jgi:hypothetical protein
MLPCDARLSPAEVGELLGLSRRFVVRLLEAGVIPSEYLPNSPDRVVQVADVLEFQAGRERRREGRRRMAEAIEEAGLPY